MRRRLRFAVAALFVAATFGVATPAHAGDPLVCVSLYYYQAGVRHDVLTHWCQGPTWWFTTFEQGPGCVLDPSVEGYNVCGDVTLSLP